MHRAGVRAHLCDGRGKNLVWISGHGLVSALENGSLAETCCPRVICAVKAAAQRALCIHYLHRFGTAVT